MYRIAACTVFACVLLMSGATDPGFVSTASAQSKSYGCFRIIEASSVRIRKRPYLWSKTIGYAQRGQKVVKNRRFCSVRGTWCRVRKGDLSGWIGKKFLKKVDC